MRFALFFVLLLAGCGTPSLLVTPVLRDDRLEESVVRRGTSDRVVVIPIDGLIVNARTGGNPLLGGAENQLAAIEQQLQKAADDRRVKAVVLRINSPGGTVTGSDTLYEMVRDFRSQSGKPVVASCQEVAASGGYYVAMAADAVVAHPTSVVGSIGVIFQTFSVQDTLSMLGVKTEAIKSGELKDMGSPLHDLPDGERKVLQALVDEYFGRFETLVGEKRKLDGERLDAVTDGRIFSGQQALQRGLVDKLGGLHDAADLAMEKAGIRGATVVLYRKPFGPGGSVYAQTPLNVQTPTASTSLIDLPESVEPLPTGFYYLWRR